RASRRHHGSPRRHRPEVPRGDLALLQPRGLRRRDARQQGLGRRPPRLRRGGDLREAGDRRGRAGRSGRPSEAAPAHRTGPLDPDRIVVDAIVVDATKEEFMKRVTWGFTVLVAIAALVWIAAPAVSQQKV